MNKTDSMGDTGSYKGVPFTKVPNIIIDKYLPNLTPGGMKVLIVICRKTLGFHKPSDRIALSTMVKSSGMAKTTVIQSIKDLTKLGIIKKNKTTTPHSYCIDASILAAKNGRNDTVQKLNRGTKSEHLGVQHSNSTEVQNSNPQKSTLKEKEINSSTTINDSVLKVISEWNCRFDTHIHQSDSVMIDHIAKALNQFTVEKLITAMDNRRTASYYKEKKPELLHKPTCFFHYPDTIANDLKRKPDSNLYTHLEMIDLITKKGYDGDKFIVRSDKLDSNGNPMKEYVG